MSSNAEMNGSWFRRGRAVAAAVAAAASLLVGCGSGGGDQAAPATTVKAAAPVGAKENAAAAPVCFDLYRPTVQVGCAENTIGPGGGVIFYDAKTVQPWGRFLEVAPQKWNGALYKCPYSNLLTSSCGFNKALGVEAKTSDAGPVGKGTIAGYRACGADSTWNEATDASQGTILPGAAANLPSTVGSGRSNTAVLLATPSCVNGQTDAVSLAAGYRGGGLDDWFLPSLDELKKLCVFGNRDTIGGFVAAQTLQYASSTTTSSATAYDDFIGDQPMTEFVSLYMGGGCDSVDFQASHELERGGHNGYYPRPRFRAVRPIRAF